MGSSTISLGLGLGGGKAATSSGRPAGGGATPYSNEYSVAFDSTDDYVALTEATYGAGKTISAWVKFADTASVSYPIMGGTASAFKWNPSNGYIYWGTAHAVHYALIGAPSAGEWIHVAGVQDASNAVTFYKNAASTAGTSAGGGVGDFTAEYIGRFSTVYFNGKIDEVAIFDSELSSSNITAIYNSGTPVDLGTGGLNLSPVGWWRMGDIVGGTGTTITDQGSGENNGTLTNGPTFSPAVPPGYSTKAVAFDGTDDYADCGILSAFQGASSMSMSFWFKPDSSGEGPSMGSRTGSTNQWGFLRTGGVNYIQIVTSGAGKYSSFTAPSDTNWHHYCLIFSSGTFTLHIDGSAVSLSILNIGSGSVPALHSESVSFDVGRNATFYSDGLMDEVALFSSALSASNITAIYNSGVPADLTSLSPVGWWRMGEGDTFPTLADHGSGSNNATMTNMTSGDIVNDTP